MRIKKCKLCGSYPQHYEKRITIDGEEKYTIFELSCIKCSINISIHIFGNDTTLSVIKKWNKLMR